MDMRPYVTVNKSDSTFTIRNTAEFNLQMARWIMSGMYATGHETILYGLKFPHFVFSDWIADGITHKFGLDMGDQLRIKIIALIYYQSMFKDGELNNEDLEKLLIRSKGEVVMSDMVKEIFEQVKGMRSLQDMLNSIHEVTGNVRLKGIDINIIINIFANSWMGTNAKEMSILALEHPPTWISLVQTALIERTYRRSTVTNIVNRKNKRGSGPEFLTSLSAILKGHKDDGSSLNF